MRIGPDGEAVFDGGWPPTIVSVWRDDTAKDAGELILMPAAEMVSMITIPKAEVPALVEYLLRRYDLEVDTSRGVPEVSFR